MPYKNTLDEARTAIKTIPTYLALPKKLLVCFYVVHYIKTHSYPKGVDAIPSIGRVCFYMVMPEAYKYSYVI
jgi:hypothetical protein